jgi:hypothetical protein
MAAPRVLTAAEGFRGAGVTASCTSSPHFFNRRCQFETVDTEHPSFRAIALQLPPRPDKNFINVARSKRTEVALVTLMSVEKNKGKNFRFA